MKKPKTVQTAFRLPVELVKRLDAYATAYEKRCGIPVSRADVVRRILDSALKGEMAGELPEIRG